MCESKDCVKYIERQTPHLNQEPDASDWSKTEIKISFNITDNQKISDFWGIRR